mgnify:CR=1 FL=1
MAKTYLPSTEAAMAVKARLTAAKAAARTRERSSRHSQIYEWHCLKDESCELPEERPEIMGRFLVDLILEFVNEDGTRNAARSGCWWSGRGFVYMTSASQKAQRVFWRKAVAFEDELDQRLFKTLNGLDFEAADAAERLKKAETLIEEGADVNATTKCCAIPDGYMLACLLNECRDARKKTALVHFFLNHGFDPHEGYGLNGAQAMTHLFRNNDDGEESSAILDCLKKLLDAGSNPITEFRPLKSVLQGESSLAWARAELADVIHAKKGFTSLAYYSAIYRCLEKASLGRDYKGVECCNAVVGKKILGIGTWGEFDIHPDVVEKNYGRYSQRAMGRLPFDSGLLLMCSDTFLCLDPGWGIYADQTTDFPKVDKLKIEEKSPFSGVIHKVSAGQPYDALFYEIAVGDKTLSVDTDPHNHRIFIE